MVIRERYLKLIRPFYKQDLIKVLIGIRRSGKSVILKQIMDELRNNGIDDKHIIYINFEDYDSMCYFQNSINKYGLTDELKKAGAKEGDTVRVNEIEFDFVD